MPADTCHDGTATSKTYQPALKRMKMNPGLDRISSALDKPIHIRSMGEDDIVQTMKRKQYESKTYERLQSEYITLFNRQKDTCLPSVIRRLDKARMRRIKAQMEVLEIGAPVGSGNASVTALKEAVSHIPSNDDHNASTMPEEI